MIDLTGIPDLLNQYVPHSIVVFITISLGFIAKWARAKGYLTGTVKLPTVDLNDSNNFLMQLLKPLTDETAPADIPTEAIAKLNAFIAKLQKDADDLLQAKIDEHTNQLESIKSLKSYKPTIPK